MQLAGEEATFSSQSSEGGRKSLMPISIGLTAVTAIFAAVAMTGASTESSVHLATSPLAARLPPA